MGVWTHHEVIFPLPIVNGIHVRSVPKWIVHGIKAFATYGSVSNGSASRVIDPPGYVLELRDRYQTPNQVCHVELIAYEREDTGAPVLVVGDVDVG